MKIAVACFISALALSHSARADEPPVSDPFTAAFVSGVARVCSAAWAQAQAGNAEELTLEDKRALQAQAFEAGGFSRGAEQADMPNLIAMEATGVPGKARMSDPGQVYVMIFGSKPECVVGGFGAPLQRPEAIARLKDAGWTVSARPEEKTWLAYTSAGDTSDSVLILRTVEDAQPGPRTFRASVIAVPRSALRPGVLEALAGE